MHEPAIMGDFCVDEESLPIWKSGLASEVRGYRCWNWLHRGCIKGSCCEQNSLITPVIAHYCWDLAEYCGMLISGRDKSAPRSVVEAKSD